MLSNNSNKIRNVKGHHLLQAGGKKGRPTLLHNGINGQKGGVNSKGTPKSAKMKEDHLSSLVKVLKAKGKKRGV